MNIIKKGEPTVSYTLVDDNLTLKVDKNRDVSLTIDLSNSQKYSPTRIVVSNDLDGKIYRGVDGQFLSAELNIRPRKKIFIRDSDLKLTEVVIPFNEKDITLTLYKLNTIVVDKIRI